MKKCLLGRALVFSLIAMSVVHATYFWSQSHKPTADNSNDLKAIKEIRIVEISVPNQTEEKIEPTKYFDVPLDENLQDHIFSLCEENNIDPAIVIAIISKESNFDEKAIGDNGNSLGLMQIQPRWHQERMDILGCTDLLDPYQNVAVGIDYLADLYATGESTEWVLMAYNGGYAYAYENMSLGTVSEYAESVLYFSEHLERIEETNENNV